MSLLGPEFDPLTGEKTAALQSVKVYANSHYVTPRPTLLQAIEQIKRDLKLRLDELFTEGKLLEAQRLVVSGLGFCKAALPH